MRSLKRAFLICQTQSSLIPSFVDAEPPPCKCRASRPTYSTKDPPLTITGLADQCFQKKDKKIRKIKILFTYCAFSCLPKLADYFYVLPKGATSSTNFLVFAGLYEILSKDINVLERCALPENTRVHKKVKETCELWESSGAPSVLTVSKV